MKLTWYGTAALSVEEQGTRIFFDPFPGIPIGALSHPRKHLPDEEIFRSATAVCITHGHVDHIYYVPQLYAGSIIPIYATDTPCHTLAKLSYYREGQRKSVEKSFWIGNDPSGKRNLKGKQLSLRRIYPGWIRKFGRLQVTAYQSRHCRFDFPLIARTVLARRFWQHPVHLIRLLSLNLKCPERGETLFYEVTDGKIRLQIMGSLNLDNQTEYPTGADVLILPLQGRSDLDTYALNIVSRLKPKKILLDHYDDAFPPMSDTIDTSGFVRMVRREFGISVMALTKGNTLII